MAAHPESFADKIDRLVEIWTGLHIEQVFRVDLRDLASRGLRWGSRLMGGGRHPLPPARSMVDTAPLRELLGQMLGDHGDGIRGIAANLGARWLRAVAITGSSYTSGQSLTWVQACESCGIQEWERPHRRSLSCVLRVDHVLASAALPFFFPEVHIDGAWYGDGGIRLTAPLSPAVHLGARRIVSVSTRYVRGNGEAERSTLDDYPPPAQVAGALYNAIFLDQLDGDAYRCGSSTG